jgi:tetratricopeptide (TPR) repeat protein
MYIRLGYSKKYFLSSGKGLRGPAVYHALPLAGLVLCVMGLVSLVSDLETRQKLLIYLVAPALLAAAAIGVSQPSWLKPEWLRRLQANHPDVFPFLREVAQETVGEDPDKVQAWSEAMDSRQGQDEWVAKVRKSRGWPRRELQTPEQPSVKVPRRFRDHIGRIQALPPSSKGLEDQIEIYEEILSQLKWEDEPAFWATVQNKLGIAYAARRRGNRVESLEKAIAAYEAALEVTEKRGLSLDWAMVQNNLGTAYRRRTVEDKADNLDKAIAAYEAALEVLTRNKHPLHHAGTQMSLGITYFKRSTGDRRENLEKAIACHQAALEVYAEETFPEERGRVRKRLDEATKELSSL